MSNTSLMRLPKGTDRKPDMLQRHRMTGRPAEERQMLTVAETVNRAKLSGMGVSEYTLRRAIRSGAIPCRKVGRKYLLYWPNVERWLMCVDGQDNIPPDITGNSGIRRIEV
ncbi:MAG: helix-turn-helix domain-containing protein [Clostridia bacterium]|nr:helix-turn-helix domain-containing protein [Clostridia bacterium]